MKTYQRIELMSNFGIVLNDICQQKTYSSSNKVISEALFTKFTEAIKTVHIHNGWFTEENVIKALAGYGGWLTTTKLNDWLSDYSEKEGETKVVGLIMAGNIPLVGFHDFLAVFLSGHSVQMKLSSDDSILWPIITEILSEINPEFEATTTILERLKGFDAVIATGSNNSSMYFETYFGKYPHIFRKNRTSVAVISGNESTEDLQKLGVDIFSYFGLGCRNVTQLLVPKNYNLTPFFESIYSFNNIVNHNKYANNYDYNKAIYLLNREDLLDNNFLLVRRSKELNSPIGVLFRHEYENAVDLDNYLKKHKSDIQAIVGKGYIPFGESQSPELTDYADGVDTMAFLTTLK